MGQSALRTGAVKSRQQRIRQTHPVSTSLGFEKMTRRQAIRRIRALLGRTPRNPGARHLIVLFNVQPEELSEAGVSYEVLRALESQGCFLV